MARELLLRPKKATSKLNLQADITPSPQEIAVGLYFKSKQINNRNLKNGFENLFFMLF